MPPFPHPVSHHSPRRPAMAGPDAPGLDASGLDASWRRCGHDHGLDPFAPHMPPVLCGAELRQCCQRAGNVLRHAETAMDRMRAMLSPLGYATLLADADGVVLTHRIEAEQRRGCRRWCLWPGAIWNEAREGTNAVGTSLAEGRSIAVHGAQHWRTALRGLACVATPVHDALGRVAGVINASSFHPSDDGREIALIAATVAQAARGIERMAFMDLYRGHAIMLLGEGTDGSVPMIAVDDERVVVGATHAARVHMGIAPAQDLNFCLLDDTAGEDAEGGLRHAQKMAIRSALATARGKVAVAARILGISRSTLHRKLRMLGPPAAQPCH
ncbi:helix-turn-helix domain-containing protein [Novacetimonas pomaceti]|uniref:Fis family transcriptional regulator n=1 Tax=Novacetimonas pomaceti TaxID=2021998 RepID=A0A318QAQ0_9PROT|nr:helix-turn-helix domain-containing protein [Novacetimonas pomaceti]MBV1834729.1 GAF domain-containing protein [Novacetimonas pomaceti]PYD75995.1 Fis family transcriptional regulator [Novacetimonas pomaceti]